MGKKIVKKSKVKESKEMKQKMEKSEAEEKEACGKEADEAEEKEAADEEGDKENVGDPAHDDEAQDVALIKKLIAEYLGKDGEMDESQMETMQSLAKEAYEAYKEMGYSEDEAKEHAGHALKLAKHMASKQEAGDGDVDADKKAVPAKKDDSKDKKSDDSGDEETDEAEEKEQEASEGDETKESDEKSESKESSRVKKLELKLIETQGQLAALKMRLSKEDVEKYVETKLSESKRPRAVTKAFRESAGVIKSKEDFTAKWAIFCEGLKNSRVAVDYGAMFTEKGPSSESGDSKSKGLDFSNCAE